MASQRGESDRQDKLSSIVSSTCQLLTINNHSSWLVGVTATERLCFQINLHEHKQNTNEMVFDSEQEMYFLKNVVPVIFTCQPVNFISWSVCGPIVENTLCSKKSDAKIQITITMAHLVRINYLLSSFNYHLSGTSIANFNKIYHTFSEPQLFKKFNLKIEFSNMENTD